MLQLVVMAAGATVVYGLSGSVGEWLLEEGTVLISVLLLALLHPRARDLLHWPRFDRDMTMLAAIASIPWVEYIVDNSRLQVFAVAGIPTPRWSIGPSPLCWGSPWSPLPSSAPLNIQDGGFQRGSPGRVRCSSGSTRLAFPGLAFALTGFWTVAAVVWGVVFVTVTERRSRATPTAVGSVL